MYVVECFVLRYEDLLYEGFLVECCDVVFVEVEFEVFEFFEMWNFDLCDGLY